ncbi:type II toxin-antitoxin system VapC family toxin [Chlorogloea sp. CCALA 695]|uniref:type II toxin-antitoxin system VapC family toxin n=1 Tax=Chlorogloea sp. CCALA 695 TaxID=2107693 RepID=UPI000D084F7D|nr:type II toxin-antitoxin system VapC family toxin [Chlorogloea sp. CCALA 695]PSB28895.1 VapC toxin family PIN domain ribonuclease [Chlorogloea sp. CCALA 695]
MSYLLDTNIVTAHLKNNLKIKEKLETQEQEIFISCLTYYEIKRGLLAINALYKLSTFQEFCRKYKVLLLDNLQIIEKAAEIHAYLKRKGTPIQDADVLIAATAIVKGLIVVSNDSDMLRVVGVTVENWLNLE